MKLTEAGGIANISGYLAHQTHKKLECQLGSGVLISDQKLPLGEIDNNVQDALPECYDYIRLQDRGGLLYTSDFTLKLINLGLCVFGAIANDSSLRTKFFSSHSTKMSSTMCFELWWDKIIHLCNVNVSHIFSYFV